MGEEEEEEDLPTSTERLSDCKRMCYKNRRPWSEKCAEWKSGACAGCPECAGPLMCSLFPADSVPEFGLVGSATPVDFVDETFEKYSLAQVNASDCVVRHVWMIGEKVPFDPTGRVPNPLYNQHVSTQILQLPRPLEVGDILACPHCLAGGWTNTTFAPDPFRSTSNDLTAGDPGTPAGVPDATVTCRNSTVRARVSGMRCAYCDIPSTCMAGMGCFRYFASSCHYGAGSAQEAARLMTRKLMPAGAAPIPP